MPKTAELSTAWAALDALVRAEFTDRDLIAGCVHAQLQRLYVQMQTVLAVGDTLPDLLAQRHRGGAGPAGRRRDAAYCALTAERYDSESQCPQG